MTYNPREYWERRPQKQGADYVGHHQATADEHDRQQAVFMEALATELLGRHKPLLLDFGCGSGRFMHWLARQCDAYVGVDISMSGIALAPCPPQNARLEWLAEDRIPLDDDSVDTIVAVTVIQHIPEWEFFGIWAPELRRVLKRFGGRALVIDDPNGKAEHMHSRDPEHVAAAMGCSVCSAVALETGHWCALLKSERVHV